MFITVGRAEYFAALLQREGSSNFPQCVATQMVQGKLRIKTLLCSKECGNIGGEAATGVIHESPLLHAFLPVFHRQSQILIDFVFQFRELHVIRRINLEDFGFRNKETITLAVPDISVRPDLHELRLRAFDYVFEKALKLRRRAFMAVIFVPKEMVKRYRVVTVRDWSS